MSGGGKDEKAYENEKDLEYSTRFHSRSVRCMMLMVPPALQASDYRLPPALGSKAGDVFTDATTPQIDTAIRRRSSNYVQYSRVIRVGVVYGDHEQSDSSLDPDVGTAIIDIDAG